MRLHNELIRRFYIPPPGESLILPHEAQPNQEAGGARYVVELRNRVWTPGPGVP
jgi:hypothetical protein